jgi:glycosyltransferase involved in cell wall biosynthesis
VNHLLHPELFPPIPIVGERAAEALNQRIGEMATDDLSLDPRITVGIRTFNEAPKLELLLQDVARQAVGAEVEVVVVDNESTDHTKAVAKEYGAEVVTLPRGEFTYPRSMNLAMDAASHDAVFLTIAHAQLSSTHTLHAGARHFALADDVAGVYAMELSAPNASRTDNWMRAGNALELFCPPRRIHKAGMAVMGATGAIVSKTAWNELGRFDERYETGGEDTALARDMLKAGYGIVKEPAMAVHHAHGLGLGKTAKEMLHYMRTVRGPVAMQRELLTRRQSRLGES